MNSTLEKVEPDKQILFGLGNLYVTRGIQALMDQGLDITPFLQRHMTGDDGDLDEEDKAENRLSLKHNYRILSAYHFSPVNDPDNKIKFWIITEADRSVTTVLLPEEY
ncbi:hypothetical protein A1353_23090 [Methylomonas methanica]|uniref:Uncharacterized protein n=1 Tax=Methylomonas methanica TaxID=421 RepID=A0A177LV86_METMH|nr:hypothetical protein [Methylomonas methanica]OAH97375.1 hypothetical protein A1353_23090 [Methylomonas methanica]